jgi:crossover junction endodeoxyribonuclease RuvC
MLILGLDPGSRVTGWGIVRQDGARSIYVASGALHLDEEADLATRLADLSVRLDKLLRDHRPDCAAIEQIFSAKSARSALILGHARGVLLATLARARLPIHEYPPVQVKQAVTGSGRADKDQVQRMVAVLLNHRTKMTADESDALAVALSHGAAISLGRAGS